MKNLFLIKLFFLFIFFSGCQTIENKSKTKDNKGARVLIYKNKKYGITCERKFELNDSNMIVGFSSKGCF